MPEPTSKMVLVVEDDPDIRSSILELLGDIGIEATGAENGQVALNLLASGPRPGLILLDLMMPVMDSFEFRERQLQNPQWAMIPVVVMSADGNVAEKQCRAQAAAYLRKPVDIHDLLQLVADKSAPSGA